jgi:hypothetical protein
MTSTKNSLTLGVALALPLLAFNAEAKVSAAEAAKLGDSLTMIGAEAGANADGSIPAFQGKTLFTDTELGYTYSDIEKMSRQEQSDTLAAYMARNGANEVVLEITGANYQEHADKLTEGHKALFAKFPNSYKMKVYKTMRSAFFPEEIEAATKANATTASLNGTDSMQGATLGFPFPIPTSGAEPIWNHKTKYRGNAVIRYNNQAIVKTDGTFKLTKVVEDVLFTYANLAGNTQEGILLYYLQTDLGSSGTRTLVHETADQAKDSRNAWLYNKGFGRLKRAPNVGYDNPSQTSDGEQFNDQVDMFNGALDRYNWKLVGKKEMYMPYNSADINSPVLKYNEILKAGHVNQDLARYELHRVWVVEATLQDGKRHKLGKRVMYVDEDSWSINAVDGYDGRGELWKFQEGHMVSVPWVGTASAVPELIYDLQSGRYFATAMVNEEKLNNTDAEFEVKYFKPANVAKRIK